MLRSIPFLVAAAATVFANVVDPDAFEGDDLSHLVTQGGNGLLEPEDSEFQHHHGDWNAALLARSPHYTTRVRDSMGEEYDLTYYDTGDANITHGDIMLPLDFTEHLQKHADHEVAGIHMLGAVQTSTRSMWPCPIPYVNSLGSANPRRIDQAIAHIEKLTNFRFVQRTTERDYMDFVPSSGCSSYIGRIGGRQAINLARGCGMSSVAHEIMHAMGIFHEQSRPDRDQYVRINEQNIQQGTQNNFRICSRCTTSGPYDCNSVMHYSANAFSVNGRPTIENIGCTNLCRAGRLGQYNGLTRGDVDAIMERYNPNSGCSGGSTPPEYTFDACTGRNVAPTGTTTRATTQTQATTSRNTQTTQTQATTSRNTQTTQTQATTTTRRTTTVEQTTRPVVTLPNPGTQPPVSGACTVFENTAHQGFPYRGAIAQITNTDRDGCCERCNDAVNCQSWTFLRQGGISFCLLYSTPLSEGAYRGVSGYTSGSRAPANVEEAGDGSGSNTAYIAGGVAAASAVLVGGAAVYSRKKSKAGKKSASAGYTSNDEIKMIESQREVEEAMRAHNVARVGGATPSYA